MAIYRATVFGHLEGGETFNFTLHIQAVTGLDDVIAARVADAVTLMWSGTNTPAGNITALYPASIGVNVDELDDLNKNAAQSIVGLSLVGTGTSEPLPPQCAIAVSLRTALPTRAGRGRFFLPSPIVDTVVSQRLDSASQTDILNGALAMLEHIKAVYTPVIFHRNNGTGDEIISVDVGDVFDNQRRRRNQLVETRVRHALT